VHSHPVLKNIKVRNNGVGISTKEGSTARAIFNGVVTKILIIPGAGKVVIVQHGDYLTVYGNLKDVYVTSGDQVKTKQILGEILTNRGKTELQFEIHKGKEATALDPTLWLFKGR
jgi:murein DD-endopeptidase MepM/ murein hydrolase activator NlpD